MKITKENFGDPTIFGNLNIKDAKKNPFPKELVRIWAQLSYEENITLVDSFLSQNLRYNSLIRIMDKPPFYKNWHQMGISTVSDTTKEKPNSFFPQRNLKLDITLRSAHLLSRELSALKTLWARQKPYIIINTSARETFATVLAKSKKPRRLAYQKLLESKTEMLIRNQQK